MLRWEWTVWFWLVAGLFCSCERPQDGALIGAAREGDAAIVETVLVQGARVGAQDEQGWSALMWAAAQGHTAIVELLLSQGAAVDQSSPGRMTSLMLAALDGHVSVVEQLIHHGAEVNARDKNGNTALMAASQRGHIATVRFLLKQGADFKLRDHQGNTALILAADGDYLDSLRGLPSPANLILAAQEDLGRTVQALVDAGADTEIRDGRGRTALMCAAASGQTNLVKILRKAGVDPQPQSK